MYVKITGLVLLLLLIISLAIGNGFLEGYTNQNTQFAMSTTNQTPTTIDQLQLFIAQFNTTQQNIDSTSAANIAILQQLVTASINDSTNTNKTIMWSLVPGSQESFNALQTAFNTKSADESPLQYTPNININISDAPDVSEYHLSASKIMAETDAYGLQGGTAYVFDNSGNKVALSPTGKYGNATYFEPGTYKFGASTYVPNYEDSVYLSRSTGLSQAKPVRNAAFMRGDLCSYYKHNPNKLEEICQNTKLHDCASKPCCVLLGGSKCVSGDATGPKYTANYSDIYIKNKDFYYYKNKCYGNCQNTHYKKPLDNIHSAFPNTNDSDPSSLFKNRSANPLNASDYRGITDAGGWKNDNTISSISNTSVLG
jgi:hypothetical protein